MDSKDFRPTGKQVATTPYHSPPPPPTTCHFSQQAFRAPYNQSDESLTDTAASYRDPDFRRSAELFRLPSSNVLREEHEVEMEKEKIRCRIIAAEILRRRSLLAALRGPFPDAFSLISASSVALRPRFSARCESWAIEERERLALSSEERSDIAGFKRIETVAFQRVPEPRVSEIEPSLEAMPGKNQSGAKRKALTPLEAGASELHLVDVNKKPKEDWSCSTCQVNATSELSLYQHLQGKKHKAREALATGKSYAIGFFPKQVQHD